MKKTFISNFNYFVEIMNDHKRIYSIIKKLQVAVPEKENPKMIIINYSDEGMCFFEITPETETDYIREVEFTGTGS